MISYRVRGATSPLALMRRVFVFIAVLCLLAPAGALASKQGGERLINDCKDDGEINKGPYSPSDYTYALGHLQGDAAEYTNCDQVISEARRAAAGGRKTSGGRGGRGSSAPPTSPAPAPAPAPSGPTSAEKRSIGNAAKAPGPVDVGGGPPITPGGPGITTTSFAHAVPGPMLVVLALLLLGALGTASPAIASRVRARRQG